MRLLSSYKVLGVIFLSLVVLSVYLTYAVFTKKFTEYDRVALETSSIGCDRHQCGRFRVSACAAHG
ncbi:MAG: hypothetical protein LH477_11785 [Nocardioides sp.]|nr:hypothetical protein [Nocardioides sp.]